MKVIIFHGWGASPEDNWFPWLKHELEKSYEVLIPRLPNSQHPKQNDWLNTALKLGIDEDTVLVGHSLGCILIMRILEQKRVNSAYLVSSFDENLGISDIMDFFKSKFNYDVIEQNAKIFMLSSNNDPYIPLNTAERLADKLNCHLKVFQGTEHLSRGTKNFEFPELRDMIYANSKKA